MLHQMEPAGKTYALLIGIGTYEYHHFQKRSVEDRLGKHVEPWPELTRLTTPRNDLAGLQICFEEHYAFESIKLLPEDHATRDGFWGALDSYKGLGKDDTLVLAFWGHGTIRNHKTFWLPYDACKDAQHSWISFDDLRDKFKDIPVRHILVIADACFSGNLGTKSVTETKVKPYRQDQYDKASRIALTSGGNQPVLDRTGPGNRSYFANALIAALKSAPSHFVPSLHMEFIRRVTSKGNDNYQTPQYFHIPGALPENADAPDTVFGGESILFKEGEILVPEGFEPLEKDYKATIASYLNRTDWYPWSAFARIKKPPTHPNHGYDEQKLFDHIANLESDESTTFLITGHGGVGKTRFAIELGRIAQERDWQVWRVTKQTRREHFAALRANLSRYSAPILFILDYVESLEPSFSYDDLMTELETLQLHTLPVRFITTCRKTYWDNSTARSKLLNQNSGRCEILHLSGTSGMDADTAEWLRDWLRASYARIVTRSDEDFDARLDALEPHQEYLPFYGVLERHLELADGIEDRFKISESVRDRLIATIRDDNPENTRIKRRSFEMELVNLLMLFPWKIDKLKHLTEDQREIIEALENEGFCLRGGTEIEIGHDLLCDVCFEKVIHDRFDRKVDIIRELGEFARKTGQLGALGIALGRTLPYLTQFASEQHADPAKRFNSSLALFDDLAPELLNLREDYVQDAEEMLAQCRLSMSLTIEEKLRVLFAVCRFSEEQLHELQAIFKEELPRFVKLADEHPTDVFSETFFLNQFGGNTEFASQCFGKIVQTKVAKASLAQLLANPYTFPDGNDTNQLLVRDMHKLASQAAPNHAGILGSYALFLKQQGEPEAARAQYEAAIKADPEHANNLGNFSKLLFEVREFDEAENYLKRAEQLADNDELRLELSFYRYVHVAPHPLATLKELVLSNQRCLGWPLNQHVEIARERNHPNPDLVAAIADVISNDGPVEQLDSFSDWSGEVPPGDAQY